MPSNINNASLNRSDAMPAVLIAKQIKKGKKKKRNYLADNSFILSSTPLTSFSRSSLYSFSIASFSSFVRKLLTPYPQWPPQPYRIPFTSLYIGYAIYGFYTIYLYRVYDTS